MGNLSKYVVYKCDVCNRQIELLLDGRRPDPIRCNITLRCRGFLDRITIKTTKSSPFPAPVAGLDDFVPRGAPLTTPSISLIAPIQLTINTSSIAQILTMALFRREISTNTTFSVLDVNGGTVIVETQPAQYVAPALSYANVALFELTQNLLQFKKFTYTFKSLAQVVRGIDDSAEGLNLRFTVTDLIRVFVNGIEIDSNGFDRSITNQITLTPAIFSASNVVEILVYQDIDLAVDVNTLTRLKFVPLDPLGSASILSATAWGDVQTVSINNIDRSLLYCSDLGLLQPDKTYGVYSVEAISQANVKTIVQPAEVYLLLGRDPFSFQDKELHAFLNVDALITGDATLVYKNSLRLGTLNLFVDETAVTEAFNQIRIKDPLTLTSTANVIGVDDRSGTEELTKKYIRGPS